MDSPNVGALIAGEAVDAVFYVEECQVREIKGKSERYGNCRLRRSSGSIAGKRWQITDADAEVLRTGRFAKVRGRVQEYKGTLQLNIEQLSPIDPSTLNMDDFIATREGGGLEPYGVFKELVKSVQDVCLVAVLKRLFSDDANLRKCYTEAPAAQVMHHAYRFGLIEHSVEVARLCDAACKALPEWGLNRDLLLTGALLHDIGKTAELDCSRPDFGFSLEGGLVGHVFLGLEMVRAAIRGVDGFPPTLEAALLHLIAAHHSKREWGAAVPPALPEALILGKCDQMSAEMYYVREARQQATGDGFVSAKGLEGRVYVGPVTRSGPAAEGVELPTHPDAEAGSGAAAEGRPILRIVAGGRLHEGDEPAFLALPVLGRIAAGSPMGAEQEVEDHAVVPADLVHDPDKAFVLKVRGDSMRDAHILDGDLVVVEKRSSRPREGDIVAAVVNGEVTVKRFALVDGRPVLRAENPEYADIGLDEGDYLEIQGKVAGVLRLSLQ